MTYPYMKLPTVYRP